MRSRWSEELSIDLWDRRDFSTFRYEASFLHDAMETLLQDKQMKVRGYEFGEETCLDSKQENWLLFNTRNEKQEKS